MGDITATLKALPEPKELIRRVNIVAQLNKQLDADMDRIDTGFGARNATRYHWEDGGGQEANIIWRENGTHNPETFLLAYDHESIFNMYGDSTAVANQTALHGLPDTFNYLTHEPDLYWAWDETKLVYATFTAWWDDDVKAWTASQEWLAEATKEDDDGGLDYCYDVFTFEPGGEEFVERYLETWEDAMSERKLRKIIKQVVTKNS